MNTRSIVSQLQVPSIHLGWRVELPEFHQQMPIQTNREDLSVGTSRLEIIALCIWRKREYALHSQGLVGKVDSAPGLIRTRSRGFEHVNRAFHM